MKTMQASSVVASIQTIATGKGLEVDDGIIDNVDRRPVYPWCSFC